MGLKKGVDGWDVPPAPNLLVRIIHQDPYFFQESGIRPYLQNVDKDHCQNLYSRFHFGTPFGM